MIIVFFSIFKETTSFPIEVIVADNGSKDGSCEMIKRKYRQVKLIENSTNIGFTKGTNQCFDIARGEYVLMLNSDTVILDRAIEKTAVFADTNSKYAAIGCRLKFPNGEFQNSCFRVPNLYGIFIESIWLAQIFKNNYFLNWNRYGCHDQYWKTSTEVDCVMGSFVLLRNSVLKKIGFLDTNIFMYGEETDLCYRIKKKGYKILYYPDASIIHVHSGSQKNAADEAWSYRANIRGILFFLYKWKRLSAYFGNIILAIFILPRIIVWSIYDLNEVLKSGAFKKNKINESGNFKISFKIDILTSNYGKKMGKKMRIVLLTREGKEHYFVANKLSSKINLTAIILDKRKKIKKIKRLKNLVKRYSYMHLLMRFIGRIISVILRDMKCKDNEMRKILGNKNFILHAGEIPVIDVDGINNHGSIDLIRSFKPDVLLIYGTGIIQDAILEIPLIGALNMHTGISPHYRGAGCSFWPLYNNEPNMIGATIHECTSDVDGGMIYSVKNADIELNDTIFSMFPRSVLVGAELYVEVVNRLIRDGKLYGKRQNLRIGYEYKSEMKSWTKELIVRVRIKRGLIRKYVNSVAKET